MTRKSSKQLCTSVILNPLSASRVFMKKMLCKQMNSCLACLIADPLIVGRLCLLNRHNLFFKIGTTSVLYSQDAFQGTIIETRNVAALTFRITNGKSLFYVNQKLRFESLMYNYTRSIQAKWSHVSLCKFYEVIFYRINQYVVFQKNWSFVIHTLYTKWVHHSSAFFFNFSHFSFHFFIHLYVLILRENQFSLNERQLIHLKDQASHQLVNASNKVRHICDRFINEAQMASMDFIFISLSIILSVVH